MHIIRSNDHATATLAQELNDQLKVGEVLLLLSGGSSVQVGIEAVKSIEILLSNRLHIGLADERYGDYLHANSNWKALLAAGLPEDRGIWMHPIITTTSLSIEETAATYEKTLRTLIKSALTVIALFGVGEDDHIAGILPNSPAATEKGKFVFGYDGGKFKRITITPPFFTQIAFGMIVAKGENKRASIARLSEKLDSIEHPDQLIHQCAKNSVFFNL